MGLIHLGTLISRGDIFCLTLIGDEMLRLTQYNIHLGTCILWSVKMEKFEPCIIFYLFATMSKMLESKHNFVSCLYFQVGTFQRLVGTQKDVQYS